ncbi:MAG TPA: type IVB secretion system protein IcmH/DotU [Alphaproteobacteria bacterium]|nr:type IVB secretion system protein IcmH/DotU [Alphaproteobacteria bacterium]
MSQGGDSEKTIIRPNPGGRRPGAPDGAFASGPLPAAAAGPVVQVPQTGINALVAAATPLLTLAVRLRGSTAQRDVDGLHGRVAREIKAFEQRALAAGCAQDAVRAARYALCAMIDDLVLNTPWGSTSLWAGKSMVGTFHNETSGGERFFDILNHMHKDPGRNDEILELMYLCLSLGFEGRLRVMQRGTSEHARVRDGIFRTIRNQRGDIERELSPRWRGLEAAHRPLSSYVPLWMIAAIALLIMTGTFMGLNYALNVSSDRVFAQLGNLAQSGPVIIERAEAAPPPPPPPVAAPEQLPRIKGFLEDEIAQGLVVVFEDRNTITVRIRNEGMFASGSADVEEQFLPVLRRVAEALDDEPGAIIVAGHSDNVPIRTVRFPSNWHLSLARAEAVMEIVAARLADPTRLTAEGRAEAEPVASNATPEGREQNRRIELILGKVAGIQ